MLYVTGMDANRQIRNITLTGFMGCGKTAVGRIVAKVAGYEFLDTDQFIEEHVGKSIPRIFEEHGEETFRRYEREVVVRSGMSWDVVPTSKHVMRKQLLLE